MAHPLIQQVIDAEPKCLPGWIESFCKWHAAGKGTKLSKSGVSALCHTLIAARQRARRLVKERDEARKCLTDRS